MNLFRLILTFLYLIIFSACGLVTARPKIEMNMAQAAVIAAKEAKAEEFAPSLFRKAELYYLKAKSAYKRKYFEKAKFYANSSRTFAEQAEFEALKKAAISSPAAGQ